MSTHGSAWIEAGYASTSLLQRRCNLGYARAAHILDQLEQAKVIGPYEGAQPRVVLPPYAKPKHRKYPKRPPPAKPWIDTKHWITTAVKKRPNHIGVQEKSFACQTQDKRVQETITEALP